MQQLPNPTTSPTEWQEPFRLTIRLSKPAYCPACSRVLTPANVGVRHDVGWCCLCSTDRHHDLTSIANALDQLDQHGHTSVCHEIKFLTPRVERYRNKSAWQLLDALQATPAARV